MNSAADQSKSDILFFDGVCNLCNSSVDLVMRRDKNKSIHYSSLQSEFASSFLPDLGVNPSDLDSIAFFTDNKIYQRSSAALKIAGKMSGLYPALGVFWIVPKFIRDAVYDLVARNRYKWFGKKDSCRVPTDAERALFLE